jgi:hypothetical protein
LHREGPYPPTSNGDHVTWVVKAWKPEVLAEAQREARRVRRTTAEELRSLEHLGSGLREDVRGRRREGAPEITAGRGRARLSEGPLRDLFRAT